MDVSISRDTFIKDIIYAHKDNTLNSSYLSEQLIYYEEAAEQAVKGNLQLVNTTGNYTDENTFPVSTVKWTLMQSIFFASTICTTIGNPINLIKF